MRDEEIIRLLRSWTIDYDGTQMPRNTTPLPGLHCDLLLDAADALESLIEDRDWLRIRLQDG